VHIISFTSLYTVVGNDKIAAGRRNKLRTADSTTQLSCEFRAVVLTGSGLLVGRVECVGGKPRAVAGAARVVRVHGQPEPDGWRQLSEREVRSVGRQVGQHRWPRSVGGHRGPAVSVVRAERATVVAVRRVVRFQGEALSDAPVEPLSAPHVHREQRPVAGSAVERRVRSHCDPEKK